MKAPARPARDQLEPWQHSRLQAWGAVELPIVPSSALPLGCADRLTSTLHPHVAPDQTAGRLVSVRTAVRLPLPWKLDIRPSRNSYSARTAAYTQVNAQTTTSSTSQIEVAAHRRHLGRQRLVYNQEHPRRATCQGPCRVSGRLGRQSEDRRSILPYLGMFPLSYREAPLNSANHLSGTLEPRSYRRSPKRVGAEKAVTRD